MVEPPTLEHAAEQWARWTWNLSQAIFQRATQPGRSVDVALEDVSRAVAAPMTELVNGVQASPREAAQVIAAGLHVQADALTLTAEYIDRELGEEPEGDG